MPLLDKQWSFRDKKRNKESAGKRGDTPLHVASRNGNLGKVKDILQNNDEGRLNDLMSRKNQDGETALYVAAENNQKLVVVELLKHADLQSAGIKANNGFDAFHVAARLGHLEVLKELLQNFPQLAMTTDTSNSTALHTAAAQGHFDVVNLLLETESSLAKITKNNGKSALHSAARMGHLEVLKALIDKEPDVSVKKDKKGQTALHMAVKGINIDVVLELIKSAPSILNFEDNKGNTALHIATRKGRIQMMRVLLSAEGINVNATNKGGETPLDIAEKSHNEELVPILKAANAITSKEQGTTPVANKQLKQTVSDIKHDVESQLQQTRQTGMRVQKIAKKIKKLHIGGLNNAINSATVVAVLIATVAFAAIFTVPGQYVEGDVDGSTLGEAHIANNPAFMIFFVFDSLALFISLAVVVVQTSIVVVEHKAKRQMVFVINKLMWVACLFISVAFIALSYVVVGSHGLWLAILTTVIGSLIMLATIGSMCYFVIMHRIDMSNIRNIRKTSGSQSRSWSLSNVLSDADLMNSEKRMYAL